jgi:hypothetical protein
MRQWLFVLLLLVLPLQTVWASAAPYCAHETGTAASNHFGHHDHQHQGGGDAGASLDDNPDGPGLFHADCATCHLGCSASLPPSADAVEPIAHRADLSFKHPGHASHVPSAPDRPDRIAAACAARFGGGVMFGSSMY